VQVYAVIKEIQSEGDRIEATTGKGVKWTTEESSVCFS
jgi:hypothetical protein